MGMRERIREIYEWSGMSTTDLERETGIDRYTWGNLLNLKKKVRANEDHLEAINSLWPQFAYWVMTGKVQPEAGNINPEIERARKDSDQARMAS